MVRLASSTCLSRNSPPQRSQRVEGGGWTRVRMRFPFARDARSEAMERSKGFRLNGYIESPNALRWRLGRPSGCAFTETESSKIIGADSARATAAETSSSCWDQWHGRFAGDLGWSAGMLCFGCRLRPRERPGCSMSVASCPRPAATADAAVSGALALRRSHDDRAPRPDRRRSGRSGRPWRPRWWNELRSQATCRATTAQGSGQGAAQQRRPLAHERPGQLKRNPRRCGNTPGTGNTGADYLASVLI
jgi:hypothetical protein